MALLDPLIRAVARLFNLREAFETRRQVVDETSGVADLSEEELERFKEASPREQAQIIEDANPEDSLIQELLEGLVGGTFDTLEDAIDDELTEGDLTDLSQAELNVNDAEGVALSEALAVIGGQTAIEGLSAGQVDSFETPIAEALSFLALDDVVGTRIGVTMEQAVLPSLEAQIAKENRTQFVSLQDAVEFALRNKETDDGYLRAEGATADVRDKIGSNEPVNANNLLEEWGIRDDQLPILEEVAQEAMEFEELIETPAELGLVVDDEVLDLVLDLAGYPEPLKEFLRQVPEEIPDSNRLWEERTAVEPVVSGLETLARDGEITPQEAVDLIPDEVEEAKPALRRRFENLQDVPVGPPSGSDIEGSFASGYTDLDELRARLDRLEYDTDEYEDVLRKQVLDELDGDLQEAVALGTVTPAEFSDLAEFANVDDEAIDLLLRGRSFTDITKQRLQEQADPAELSVRTLSGVGESRGAGLRAAGVETVGDMATADPETVAEAAQVSPETAQSFIQQARQRVTQE